MSGGEAGGEMVRIVKLDRFPHGTIRVEASEDECRALAARFALPAVHALIAELTLTPDGHAIDASGRLTARFDQLCAIAQEPFANTIDERLAIRFIPAATAAQAEEDEEIELASDEPDEIEYDGAAFDLGEAVAQSFGLAIDPYATGPDADAVRQAAGIEDDAAPRGPFAALAALTKKPDA